MITLFSNKRTAPRHESRHPAVKPKPTQRKLQTHLKALDRKQLETLNPNLPLASTGKGVALSVGRTDHGPLNVIVLHVLFRDSGSYMFLHPKPRHLLQQCFSDTDPVFRLVMDSSAD